jgi:hypothetical protein
MSKDIKLADLVNLVKANMYEDLAPVHGVRDTYVSEAHKIVVMFNSYHAHKDMMLCAPLDYNNLMKWAEAAGREPLLICATPLGIWEFNLELTTPTYMSVDIPAFDINKGEPILTWYPDYESEDAWINAAMEEIAEDRYLDPAEMDLEDMMEELLNYDGNLEDYSEPIES